MKRWRWIALLLCALLTVSVFAACETKPQAESSTASFDAPVGMTKRLFDHLGERDLEEFELVILSTTEEYAFGDIQFATDELNSDPVNDAIFERNNLIEDLYNCKITVQFCGEGEPFLERVTTDCLSGTVNYQVVASGISSTGIPKLALDGLIQDLYAIEDSHLQLDGDWWDQNAIDDLSIGNKLFFASADIAVTDDEMTTMLVFNKELIEENQLEDPYQLVRDDKWTMDKMYEMCKAVAKDGGDGVMNIAGEEDTWGLIGAAFDCYRLILGGNAPMVSKDENDLPVISVTNAYNVDVFLDVYEIMTDKSRVAWWEQYYRWDDYENGRKLTDQFYAGRVLFMVSDVCSMNDERMLNSQIQYGVLPLPKYNEEQTHYASTINPYKFTCVSLPRDTFVDTDKTTFLLEAMAYYNKSEVTPLYYETTLKSKRLLDESSEEMLDIIFSNRIIDLANIFNWDDCIQYYNQMIMGAGNAVISFMESRESRMQEGIDQTVELFRDLK